MIILRCKDFARRDYEGLNPDAAWELKQKRRELARQLRDNYRSAQMATEKPQGPHGVGTTWKMKVDGHSRSGKSFKRNTERPL